MSVPARIELDTLSLAPGEAERHDGELEVEPLHLAGQTYTYAPAVPEVVLDISRSLGNGWGFRLRAGLQVCGPCWVCLSDANLGVRLDVREVHEPSEGDELLSPYVEENVLDVALWARDSVSEALPSRIVCREDCKGLCSRCGDNLNEGPCGCGPPEPDPRWGALADLAKKMSEEEST